MIFWSFLKKRFVFPIRSMKKRKRESASRFRLKIILREYSYKLSWLVLN